MNKIFKKAIATVLCAVLCLSLVVGAFAADSSKVESESTLFAVSHRGDSSVYPPNSLEAVLSAAKKGANAVSVSVSKTADGVLVLCEKGSLKSFFETESESAQQLQSKEFLSLRLKDSLKNVTDLHGATLEETAQRLGGSATLIIDNADEYYDDIAQLAKEKKLESAFMLRTAQNSKKFSQKIQKQLPIIGIYKGNVVFNAIGHLNRLSKLGMKIVQFQSKNFFNVIYGHFTAKRYASNGKAAALAPMYDPNLCGLRKDNVAGWDEMISIGFSGIETNDIDGLCEYIKECGEARSRLSSKLKEAQSAELSEFSSVSAKNLEAAVAAASKCLENGNSSLGEAQQAYSSLVLAEENLAASSQSDTQKGNLNVTAGKIIAAVCIGLLLVFGEAYVLKKRKKG